MTELSRKGGAITYRLNVAEVSVDELSILADQRLE